MRRNPIVTHLVTARQVKVRQPLGAVSIGQVVHAAVGVVLAIGDAQILQIVAKPVTKHELSQHNIKEEGLGGDVFTRN